MRLVSCGPHVPGLVLDQGHLGVVADLLAEDHTLEVQCGDTLVLQLEEVHHHDLTTLLHVEGTVLYYIKEFEYKLLLKLLIKFLHTL